MFIDGSAVTLPKQGSISGIDLPVGKLLSILLRRSKVFLSVGREDHRTTGRQYFSAIVIQ